MSDYTQITDFSVKDGLTTGDSEKIILGADFDGEFSAISSAIATKYDSGDIASKAQAEAGTLDTVLMTPLQTKNVLQDNAGMAYDIQQLADPGADRVLFWDDSDSGVVGLAMGNGVEISDTTLQLSSSLAGYGLSYSSGVLALAGSEITAAVIASTDRILFADASAANAVRYDTWADLQSSISITESQVSDLGSYLSAGDTAATLTVTTLTSTTINVGSTASSLTQNGTNTDQIDVEGDTIFSHQSGTYNSAKIHFSTSAPTTEGNDGDIYYEYTA